MGRFQFRGQIHSNSNTKVLRKIEQSFIQKGGFWNPESSVRFHFFLFDENDELLLDFYALPKRNPVFDLLDAVLGVGIVPARGRIRLSVDDEIIVIGLALVRAGRGVIAFHQERFVLKKERKC